MGLTKILEYQDIDFPIYKAVLVVIKSSVATSIAQISQQITAAKDALIKLDSEAAKQFAEIDRLSAKLNELLAENRMDFSFNSVTTISQVDNIEKVIADYEKEIGNLEGNIEKCFRRLAEISAEATKQMQIGSVAVASRGKKREELAQLSQEVYSKFGEEIKKLNELRKDIDPAYMAKYTELRKQRKMPAFVPYEGGNCSGCGMNVEVELKVKLKNSGDVAECPNCRRILYKK